MNLRLMNTAAALGLITLIFYLLHISKGIVLPLVIAMVIWYIILQFSHLFRKIKIGRKPLPYGLCLLIAFIISAGIMYLFAWLFTSSISNIITDAPKYQTKLKIILDHINHWTNNRLNTSQLLSNVNLSKMFSTLAGIVSDILSNTVLILIYLLFLILEAKTFDAKLHGMCKTEKQYHNVNKVVIKIQADINTFLKAKLFLNALAGVASYITLLFFHIPFAEFWGVFIFLLHFIPFIGPIIAVIFVLLAASIQLTTLLPFILLAVILILIQFVIGNLLEPKVMGSRLDLSPMVILLSLAFWGYIWGIIGMFLCVPIMVIIAIIFANFEKTRPIAIVMSAKGKGVKELAQ